MIQLPVQLYPTSGVKIIVSPFPVVHFPCVQSSINPLKNTVSLPQAPSCASDSVFQFTEVGLFHIPPTVISFAIIDESVHLYWTFLPVIFHAISLTFTLIVLSPALPLYNGYLSIVLKVHPFQLYSNGLYIPHHSSDASILASHVIHSGTDTSFNDTIIGCV
jgi:hypothetical protein